MFSKPKAVSRSSSPEITTQILRFESWSPTDFGSAIEKVDEALGCYRPPRIWEVIANASDSIVLAGKSGRGCITVSIFRGEDLEVLVEDDGLGVDPRVKDFLFQEKFYNKIPYECRKFNIPSEEIVYGRGGHTLTFLRKEIEELGGTVTLKSREGLSGAVLRMKLPSASVKKDR